MSNGLSKKIPLELGMSHDTFHDCELLILFPRLLGVCSVFHWELLCCSLLCTHKYVSCLDRIQFHLEHEHLQLKKNKNTVCPLGPETLLRTSNNGLEPQPSRHSSCFRSPVPTRGPQAPMCFSEPGNAILIQYILEINTKERKKFSYV